MELNKKPWPLATIYGTRKRIDTNPDFQRPPVWSQSQKQFLIDSILRNLDIPKLYWQKTGKNPDTYAVVDGQQRLRAIWEFQNEEYGLASDADDINGFSIAGKKYSELPDDLRKIFDIYPLDIVVVTDFSDDEVRDMFLRLQNGTSLKAQEKRNAMSGKMRDFIKEMAEHEFFKNVIFKNSRYTFDLIAAQCALLELKGQICNIKNSDLNSMYKSQKEFDSKGIMAKRIIKIFDYLAKAFPEKTPELERFNVISLYILVSKLIDRFVIDNCHKDLAKWFIEFEEIRKQDEKKSIEQRDPELIVYHENISRSTDSEESLKKRNEVLTTRFFLKFPDIEQRDDQRQFTFEQRLAIFRRDQGECQLKLKCEGAKCNWDNWHADHKMPWKKGGKTVVENGQLACPQCNLYKSANIIE